MAVTDSYISAKANLRENVKTLITVFGSVSGVILVGSPFTGFGGLEPLTDRWWIATASIVGAAALMGVGVYVLLRVLRPEVNYPSALRNGFNIEALPRLLRPEVRALQREFANRKYELLSKGYESYDTQDAAADAAWAAYDANRDDVGRKVYDDLNDPLIKIGYWSAFVRLHYRATWGTNFALFLGLLALFCLGTFAWAVGEKSKSSAAPTFVLVPAPSQTKDTVSPKLPELVTIYFATGKALLSPESFAAINRTRNYLREHADTSALVYAYTDTVGSPALNRPLAKQRVDVVVNALTNEGGIARSRVLTAELPETSLPIVTGQAVDERENRAVELVLVRLR